MKEQAKEVDWGEVHIVKRVYSGDPEDWREFVTWTREGMKEGDFARFFLRLARGMEEDERRLCFPLPPPVNTVGRTPSGSSKRETVSDLVDVCLRSGDAWGAVR